MMRAAGTPLAMPGLAAAGVSHSSAIAHPDVGHRAVATELGMNIHPNYALTSRPDTNRLLRWWITLAHTALFGGIFLADIAVILAMASLTGVLYHLAIYDHTGEISSYIEVGGVAAII